MSINGDGFRKTLGVSWCFVFIGILLIPQMTYSQNEFGNQSVSRIVPILSYLLDDGDSFCDGELLDLSSMSPNSTLRIKCDYDLKLSSIALPTGARLEFAGGSIVNGSLVFSEGVIDGRLLNSSLMMSGSAELVEPVFSFNPQSWGIVEGKVSDGIALKNSEIINETLNLVRELGAHTFSVSKVDAYLGIITNVRKPYAIFVPSNFNFVMSDNTNFRVQPNNIERFALLFSWEVDNVTISGGKLWGDRFTHDYSSGGPHEWGHVIAFKAVHNGVIDNVQIHQGTGDGFHLSSSSDRNIDGSLKPNRRESTNITVKNSLINNNRRNNISLVDGKDIFIERNTITNAGAGNGISPRVGVIVESREQFNNDGTVYQLEKVENVNIRSNVFAGSIAADVVLLSGEKAYVYENTFRSKRGVSVSASIEGAVYNNKFERAAGLMSGSVALTTLTNYLANGKHRVKNYDITNNTFSGYQFSIVAGGRDNKFKNNTSTNSLRGIIVGTSINLEFDNNVINSNVDNSYGYFVLSGENTIENASIKNGETNVENLGLSFSDVNNDQAGEVIIDGVDFNGSIALNKAQGITIQNSTFVDIDIRNSTPILINNN